MFGGAASFAPLAEARRDKNGIHFPYDKNKLKDAPNVDADGQLSQDEEAALYKHYGLEYSEGPSDSGLPVGHDTDTRDREPVGRDVSGPETDDAMTRSEEELRSGPPSARRARPGCASTS